MNFTNPYPFDIFVDGSTMILLENADVYFPRKRSNNIAYVIEASKSPTYTEIYFHIIIVYVAEGVRSDT